MTYTTDWSGRIVRPSRHRRNPHLTIDTSSEHVERIAWLHGTQVEADATHMFTVFAGIPYRAELAARVAS